MNTYPLAQAAYEAYRTHMLISEETVPKWEELTVRQRCAWHEAIKETCNIFAAAVTA
jgi:hypothetical protein